MPYVGIRELKAKTSEIIDKVREDKAEYIVTRRGEPTALIVPIEPEQLEDLILANHPRLKEMRRRSRKATAAGEAVPLSELEQKK